MEKLDDFDYHPLIKYQQFVNIVSFGILHYGRKKVLNNLELSHKKILDLMCGNQAILKMIKKKTVNQFYYVGVDLLPCNHLSVITKCENKVQFIQHNLAHPLTLTQKSDVIICSYGLKIAIHSFEDNFLQTLLNQANQNCIIQFVEFCLPSNVIIKSFLKFYLKLLILISRLLQLEINSSLKKLKSILVDKNKFEKIIQQLELAGFNCSVQEKTFGLLCFIRCERKEY